MTVMKGMAFFVASCLLLVVIMSPVHAVVDPMPDLDKISVKMPNVSLVHERALICVSLLMPADPVNRYIVKFEKSLGPHFNGDIDIATCEESGFPGLDEGSSVWDCSPEEMNVPNPPLTRGPICRNGGVVANGPFEYNFLPSKGSSDENGLTLPSGTGVPVGGQTGVKYIVLNVHFYSRRQEVDGYTGQPQVDLTLVRGVPSMKSVRSLQLETMGFLGPHAVGSITGSWTLKQDMPSIRILSLTGHSHELSTDFRVIVQRRNGTTDLVVRQDPRGDRQSDVSQVPAAHLEPGDKLKVECIHNNTMSSTLRIGDGDMCDVILYYTSDGDMSQIPSTVNSYDPLFAECFEEKGHINRFEENSEGYSSFRGPISVSDCYTQ